MATLEGEITRCITAARHRLQQSVPGLEEAIALAIQDIAQRDTELSPAAANFVFESLLMQHQYPDEFVVFKETATSLDAIESYVLEVRYHSSSWDDVCRFIEQADEPLTVEFQPNPYR